MWLVKGPNKWTTPQIGLPPRDLPLCFLLNNATCHCFPPPLESSWISPSCRVPCHRHRFYFYGNASLNLMWDEVWDYITWKSSIELSCICGQQPDHSTGFDLGLFCISNTPFSSMAVHFSPFSPTFVRQLQPNEDIMVQSASLSRLFQVQLFSETWTGAKCVQQP